MTRIAVLDDWQRVALDCADWRPLQARAEVEFFRTPFADEAEAAAALAPFQVILAMRERTHFPESLVARLPALRMFGLTGRRAGAIAIDALKARGVTVCWTGGGDSGAETAELALALMLAAARRIPSGDAAMRAGRYMKGVEAGFQLSGGTLGLIGVGRIGSLVARYGHALGMTVTGWSPNLTPERARAAGVVPAGKAELFAQADVVSLHLVLSPATQGIVGAEELALMREGAVLVNTARAQLVDEAALVEAVLSGRILAALDVHHREPIAPDHPLLRAPNTVLTPHVGYGVRDVFETFYRQSVENAVSFLDGHPVRVL